MPDFHTDILMTSTPFVSQARHTVGIRGWKVGGQPSCSGKEPHTKSIVAEAHVFLWTSHRHIDRWP